MALRCSCLYMDNSSCSVLFFKIVRSEGWVRTACYYYWVYTKYNFFVLLVINHVLVPLWSNRGRWSELHFFTITTKKETHTMQAWRRKQEEQEKKQKQAAAASSCSTTHH